MHKALLFLTFELWRVKSKEVPDTCGCRLLGCWGREKLSDRRVSKGLWKKNCAEESHLQFSAEKIYLSEISHREKYCKLKMRKKKNRWVGNFQVKSMLSNKVAKRFERKKLSDDLLCSSTELNSEEKKKYEEN